MAARILPTPEQLRELLRYEPDTGKLFWKKRPLSMFPNSRIGNTWNSRFADKEALVSKHNLGYLYGVVEYKKILAHRVSWAIFYGEWPSEQVDHVNGIKTDNRILNLRAATHSQNLCNSKSKSRLNSGLKGITYDKNRGKWMASIMKDRKAFNLGRFDTQEAAHTAYCEAAKRLHGEFAKTL